MTGPARRLAHSASQQSRMVSCAAPRDAPHASHATALAMSTSMQAFQYQRHTPAGKGLLFMWPQFTMGSWDAEQLSNAVGHTAAGAAHPAPHPPPGETLCLLST